MPPAAGTNGNPPAPDRSGTPGAPSDDDPTRRYDELNTRFSALEQRFTTADSEAKYWQRIANAALGRENPAGPPSPEDERRTRIREALLKVLPELKSVRTLEEGRAAHEEELTRQADAFTRRAVSSALNHAAVQVLGEGKTAKDLNPRQAMWIQKSFIDWVLEDKGRRTAYNEGEMPDVATFWKEFHQDLIATSVRATNADVERRAGRIAALPSGGPSAAPVGSPPPDLDYQNEEAVHKAAYRAAVAGR